MTEMPVRIGVNFDGFVTTGEAIALAQRAVDAGARSLWVAEHLGYREAIATCMAFAMKAPGPMLVPTAVSPYLWHPTPTAMAMATLDEVAPGCAAIASRRGQSAVPSGIGPRGRTAGPRHAAVHRGLAQAVGRRGRPRRRRIRHARRRPVGIQAERADSDLHRRDGPGHAAAGGPHRRRRGAVGGIVDRNRCERRSRYVPRAPPGTDAISPRSAAPDICSSASRATPGRPSTRSGKSSHS